MKVILEQDVPRLGKQGDVVEVNPGYARNYLFPRRLAEATAGSKKKCSDSACSVQEARPRKRRALPRLSGSLWLSLAGKGASFWLGH